MKQRDRQLATATIWIVFILLIIVIYSSLLWASADFTGLWPETASGYPAQAQDAEQLRQITAAAREASGPILAQVQESIREQFAVRWPLAAALTFVLTAVATLSTYVVWRNAGLEAHLAREAVQAEKVKRRSRIEQFMGELAPDELNELRSRLTDDEANELQQHGSSR